MKVTRDTYSGKPFRWNTTVILRDKGAERGVRVPARETTRGLTWLDAARVEPTLLVTLNGGHTL